MRKTLFIFVVVLFISGCDLLSTREAEKPDTQRSDFKIATTPQQLFQNLQDAFRERIPRNYEVCFVDQSFLNKKFVFIPSAGSTLKYNVLVDWTIEDEKQYFNNLISKATKNAFIILSLTNEISSTQGDSAQYTFDYQITVPSEDESIPHDFEGSAQFNINLDANNQWVITRWQDIKKEGFPSWSELKGIFFIL